MRKKEEVEFHRIVAWNKLAELCSQFLTKGRKVYVEGRLTTRSWNAQDGTQKQTTEIIINDMILLDNRRTGGPEVVAPEDEVQESPKEESQTPAKAKKTEKEEVEEPPAEEADEDEVAPDDIPF